MTYINRIRVYELEESIKASGYPMSEEIDLMEPLSQRDSQRASKLGKCRMGTGHDNFLKGIRVAFNITYPQYLSMQLQRYSFIDIVSSQSKMHMVTKMDIQSNCNEYVDPIIIELCEEYKDRYNDHQEKQDKYFWFMKLVSNLPMGFQLTMRVNTNYLQLKTIYKQRKGHKLKEDWGAIITMIETLPKFKELIGD